MRQRTALFLIAFGTLGACATPATTPPETVLEPITRRVPDRNALWQIISTSCVPEAKKGLDPKPCASVDLARGWVTLKDRTGVAQYLTMPTDKVTGIEDPGVLANDHGFEIAWETRGRVEEKLGHPLPRDAVSMTVNSPTGRTQDQLHIHTDCLDVALRDTLATAPVGRAWAALDAPLAGHRYVARFVPGETMNGIAPFKLLQAMVGDKRFDYTLAAVGATRDGQPGFILLAQNDPHASSEQLQDHVCRGY